MLRAVGKGECQDIEGVNTLAYEIGYAVGERAGLAATGTGYYHDGTFGAGGCLALRFVELGEYVVVHPVN